MTPLEAASILVELEEETIPEWYLVVVGHLREDGQQAYKYHFAGDTQMGSVVLAIESIKHRIITME